MRQRVNLFWKISIPPIFVADTFIISVTSSVNLFFRKDLLSDKFYVFV